MASLRAFALFAPMATSGLQLRSKSGGAAAAPVVARLPPSEVNSTTLEAFRQTLAASVGTGHVSMDGREWWQTDGLVHFKDARGERHFETRLMAECGDMDEQPGLWNEAISPYCIRACTIGNALPIREYESSALHAKGAVAELGPIFEQMASASAQCRELGTAIDAVLNFDADYNPSIFQRCFDAFPFAMKKFLKLNPETGRVACLQQSASDLACLRSALRTSSLGDFSLRSPQTGEVKGSDIFKAWGDLLGREDDLETLEYPWNATGVEAVLKEGSRFFKGPNEMSFDDWRQELDDKLKTVEFDGTRFGIAYNAVLVAKDASKPLQRLSEEERSAKTKFDDVLQAYVNFSRARGFLPNEDKTQKAMCHMVDPLTKLLQDGKSLGKYVAAGLRGNFPSWYPGGTIAVPYTAAHNYLAQFAPEVLIRGHESRSRDLGTLFCGCSLEERVKLPGYALDYWRAPKDLQIYGGFQELSLRWVVRYQKDQHFQSSKWIQNAPTGGLCDATGCSFAFEKSIWDVYQNSGIEDHGKFWRTSRPEVMASYAIPAVNVKSAEDYMFSTGWKSQSATRSSLAGGKKLLGSQVFRVTREQRSQLADATSPTAGSVPTGDLQDGDSMVDIWNIQACTVGKFLQYDELDTADGPVKHLPDEVRNNMRLKAKMLYETCSRDDFVGTGLTWEHFQNCLRLWINPQVNNYMCVKCTGNALMTYMESPEGAELAKRLLIKDLKIAHNGQMIMTGLVYMSYCQNGGFALKEIHFDPTEESVFYIKAGVDVMAMVTPAEQFEADRKFLALDAATGDFLPISQ